MQPNTSNHSYKEDFSVKPHNFIELPTVIPVILGDENLDKIKYLCKLIPKDEWSGVLFYIVKEGSIKNPSTMVIEIKDILPLDKGSSAFTSYALDGRFVDYMMDNPEAMDWHVGHIHSHNVMRVFFSGTDNAELQDNAPMHNFYLSMIVNNYMDIIAKIAVQGQAQKKVPKVPVMALDEEGNPYVFQKRDFKVDFKYLFTYDCEIQANITKISVPDIFSVKVDDLFKPKVIATPTVIPATSKAPTYTLPAYQQKKFDFEKKPKVAGEYHYDTILTSYKKVNVEDLEKEEVMRATYENIVLDAFGKKSLIQADLDDDEPIDFSREVMDIIDEASEEFVSPMDVARQFLEEYLSIYPEYFESNKNEDFIFHTYRIIEVLEEFSGMYPKYIKPLITLTQRTVEKFIEDNLDKK